jgi:hypothetical protein
MGFKSVLLAGMALVLLQAQSCPNRQQKPTTPEPKQTIIRPLHEFELHEVRNGPLITTALLDRRTGRVWIWTKFAGAKKIGLPESAFVEEKVIPQPVPTVNFEDLPK